MGRADVITTERTLVDHFAAQIAQGAVRWLRREFVLEFDYSSGRTDLLGLDLEGRVVAFEAKLTDWRKAIHQAWRNTSFAEKAYVVLPRNRSYSAIKNCAEFAELGVGLCLVDGEKIEVQFDSCQHEPVIPWLHNKARVVLEKNGSGSPRFSCTADLC